MQSWSSASDSATRDRDTLVRRFVEASRRAGIVALVNAARTEREVADTVVQELCEAFDAEIAFVVVTRPEHGRRETIGQVGLMEGQAAAVSADHLCRAALGATRPETHAGDDLLAAGARRLALAPWTGEHGRQVVIGVARLYPEAFEPSEIALLEAVTPSVGHALERAWLGAERDRHAARQAALVRAAKELSFSLVRAEVLETLAAEVRRALEADEVVVWDVDDAENLRVAAHAGEGAVLESGAPEDGELLADVLRSGAPQTRQPLEDARDPSASTRRHRSCLAAPLRTRGRVTTVVHASFRASRWIDVADVDLLAGFAGLASVALGNAADHAEARRAASLDSLTGCLNHGAFQDRLREEIARAEREHESLALALFDLNDFKAVNDNFGHQAGDALIRGVADALRASVRPYDHVARYGGDEFALLLPRTGEATAGPVVDRALGAIARVSLPGQGPVNASAGLAGWLPGEDAGTLIERTDRQLLDAKRARRRVAGEPPSRVVPPASVADEREQERFRRLASAGSLGARLGRLLDERTVAETAMVELATALGFEHCLLVRRKGASVAVVAAAGAGGGQAAGILPGDAIDRCVRERRSVLTDDRRELAAPVYVGAELWGALGVRATQDGGFDHDDAQLVTRVADHVGAALRTAQLYDRLEQTHVGTAAALAAALEARDAYTADHAEAIADLAVAVGVELGVTGQALRDLRLGAIFHDIGKIAVPDAILNKPSALTAEEEAVVRRHPEVGEQILAPVPFLSGVRRIVRHDHERWDGGGYPDGLRRDAIPLGARIVLVVDAYHAMRSDRPYRRAMSESSARAELLRHAGTHFDPRVVEALMTVLERDPKPQPA